jgi:hypothetical protein
MLKKTVVRRRLEDAHQAMTAAATGSQIGPAEERPKQGVGGISCTAALLHFFFPLPLGVRVVGSGGKAGRVAVCNINGEAIGLSSSS